MIRLRQWLQLFPPLIGGRQLLLQLLQAALLGSNLRPRLLIKLRLGHLAMQHCDFGLKLFDRRRQCFEFPPLFEAELSPAFCGHICDASTR